MAIAKSIWRWDEEDKALHLLCQRTESTAELLQEYDTSLSGSTETRLIELMNDPKQPPKIRGLSAIFLGSIGTDAAREALLGLLVDKDIGDLVGWCGVEALTQVDHPDVRKEAIRLYQGKEYQNQEWAHHRARAAYLLGWVSRAVVHAAKMPVVVVRPTMPA